jgi:hypothetical protein
MRILLAIVFLAGVASCGDESLGTETRTLNMTCGADCNHAESKDGKGTAVVVGSTGRVDITVEGLPKLTGEVYEGWLAGGGETAVSTGRFNTDDTGAGSSTIVLGDISERTYARVVLTVEPEPDPSPAPDPRHSIGAEF